MLQKSRKAIFVVISLFLVANLVQSAAGQTLFQQVPTTNSFLYLNSTGPFGAYLDATAKVAPRTIRSDQLGRYVTAPSDIPLIKPSEISSGTAEGYVFFATFGLPPPARSYLMIVDNTGEPVYYKSSEVGGPQFADFKVQKNNNITYFGGRGTFWGASGLFTEMNNSYDEIRNWDASPGDVADIHDLQVLTNSHALLLVYNVYPKDLSAAGGNTSTLLVDNILQEVDENSQLVWSWRASDHLPITDTFAAITPQPTLLDYIHGNAIEVDNDGNILLSGRLLSEITKINRQTGEIMWRLGGKENQFTFTNDEGFSYQHDIRRLPNGHITLFDNGNQHSPPHSRAVEYEIDETNKVITKVWEYRQTPDIFQFFMGDVQRLPNGNTFIGWGGPRSLMTEVGPDGSKRLEFEIDQPTYGYIYRAYRFPWEGNPVTTPTLVLTNSALYMSWNGATGIQSWDVESSHYPDIFTQTTNITRTGFESSIPLANLAADACYFRVKPQRTNNITRYSDVVALDSPACGPALSLTRTPASQVLLAGKSAAYTVTLSNIGATPLRNLLVSGSTADCDMALTSLDPGRDLSYRCAIPGISQSGSYSLVATADRVGVAPVSLTVTATNTVDVYDANPTLVLSDAVLSMIWPNVSDIVSWTLEYSQIPRVFTQSVTVTQGLTQTLLPLADVPADACYFRAQPQRTSGEGPFSNVVARSDGACGVGLKLERTPSHQVALKYSAATYTVTLVNTGTVFLHNIVVTGSLPGCNLNLPNLAPNERVTYQCAVNKISENLTHTLSVLAEARPIDLNMGESGPIQVTDSNVAEVDVIQFFYPLLFSSR